MEMTTKILPSPCISLPQPGEGKKSQRIPKMALFSREKGEREGG